MIEKIRSEEVFLGWYSVTDIHVPSHLTDRFSEMAPIFKDTEISSADLWGHMKSFGVVYPTRVGCNRDLCHVSIYAS